MTPPRALLLASLLAGCAAVRPAAPPPVGCPEAPCPAGPQPAPARPELRYEPEQVVVTAADLELVGKNDEELLAIGLAAAAAGDHARAADAFGRLADLFPRSRHQATALFNAGLSHQRLEQWRLAQERFHALARRFEGPDALEAVFKEAECRYRLGEGPEARALLDELTRRPGLPEAERIRALTQRGVVELEMGLTEEAEASLRLAVSAWKKGSEAERLDDYYPAQAQFYLGEVYRQHFLAVKIDPVQVDEQRLAKDMEDKASLLLSAQGHYLRAVRMGNPDWAVAGGFRIGELYDSFHTALMEAPLPPGTAADVVEAYRAELKRRVRVLITKAITIYEATLAVAGRTRVENNRFVAATQASLERMKQALREVPPDAVPAPEPRLPRDALPDKG